MIIIKLIHKIEFYDLNDDTKVEQYIFVNREKKILTKYNDQDEYGE